MEPPCGDRAMKRIFISHSTKDVDFVYGQVKPVLDQLGFCSWCSATDVRLAADWEQQIRQALAQADWFVVILSPDAVKSEWVQAEIHWALENKRGRVIPIMARTCDPTDAHLRLGTLQFVDFRGDHADGQRRLADLIQGHAPRLGKAMSQLTTQQQPEQTTVISKRREAQVRLRIETADGATREETLKIQNWAIVGRTADADLTLLDDYVSRKHARIAVIPDLHGTRLTLMDLESANGTLLNGAGLATEQPLAIGDRIELGSTRITVLGIS